jgi:uncharacterized protein (TIGR03118 family)
MFRRSISRWLRTFRCDRRSPGIEPKQRLLFDRLEDRAVPATGFVQTALVSDVPGFAANTDRKLVNPWSIVETPTGQFRVTANGTGRDVLLDAQGEKCGADIIIPPPPGSPPKTISAPTGEVSNATSGFVITVKGRSAPATLIFSSEDGTIAAWNPKLSQTQAVIAADESASGAVYKGLAMGSVGSTTYLYATNFHAGTIDVFDSHFASHTFFSGQFTDPNAPAGFAPFGIQNIGGVLFVTFAEQDADKHDDVAGPGNGFIDEFDTSGHFLMRFASGTTAGGTLTALNSPFGMAVAPAGFGTFGGDLLVGNFGDSHVSAFNLATGQFVAQLTDTHGNPLVLNGGFQETDTKGLWGIEFGTGVNAKTLFFAAGINDESDGLFGMVTAAATSNTGSRLDFHAVDVAHDLSSIEAVIATLATSGTNASVTADLRALDSALTRFSADFGTGQAAGDLAAAIAAEHQLAADLASSIPSMLRHDLQDLANDLTKLAADLQKSIV